MLELPTLTEALRELDEALPAPCPRAVERYSPDVAVLRVVLPAGVAGSDRWEAALSWLRRHGDWLSEHGATGAGSTFFRLVAAEPQPLHA